MSMRYIVKCGLALLTLYAAFVLALVGQMLLAGLVIIVALWMVPESEPGPVPGKGMAKREAPADAAERVCG